MSQFEWQGLGHCGRGSASGCHAFLLAPGGGASRRGAVAGGMRPEAARGEPDDVGVDRDLDDGVAWAVAWPARADGENAGQGLLPGAGGELAQAPPLAGDPGAGAQGVVDGAGGAADSRVDLPPVVVVHQGEVTALRAEDL